MSLFVIGDLHLSFGTQKPMDIFSGWQGYTEVLKENWLKEISNDDTIVIPGDFSWGMKLEETAADFDFLRKLPGRKILIKGNHDYWWTTPKKNKDFVSSKGYDNIFFIQNDFLMYENVALCGSRGWFFEDTDKYSQKVAAREVMRLGLSLKSAEDAGIKEKIVFFHFPPIYKDKACNELIDIMKKYNVKECYYGHLHGYAIDGAFNGIDEGIEYKLASADHLKFLPMKIR